MVNEVREFLKALEVAIPPADKCHHAIVYCKYGNDVDGWEDKLAIHIVLGNDISLHNKSRFFFLDEGDLNLGQLENVVSYIQDNLTTPLLS